MGSFRLSFLIISIFTTTLTVVQPVRANSGNHSVYEIGQLVALRDEYLFRISPATDQLINKINQTDLANFVAQNLACFFSGNKYKDRYYAKIHECEHLIGGNTGPNTESLT